MSVKSSQVQHAAEINGVSEVTLSYLQRAAELWLLDESSEAIKGVLRIRERYDEIVCSTNPEGVLEHHELELLTHLALDRIDAITEESALALLPCVMADDATVLHRLRAGYCLLARYAQAAWKGSVVDGVWRVIDSIDARTEDERLLIRLCAAQYYGRYMNRPDLALTYAQNAQDLIVADRVRIDKYYVGNMNIIIQCHENVGDLERAMAAAREMLARGQEWKNAVIVGNALNVLIGAALETGRVGEARAYLPLFGRPRSSEDIIIDVARAIYWTVCALEEGDAQAARAEFNIRVDVGYDAPSVLTRARVLAIYAHMALLEDDDVTGRRLLQPLMACFRGPLSFMDHPAHVTAMLLAKLESEEAAGSFIRGFMEQRIERWAPRAELRRYLEPALEPSVID